LRDELHPSNPLLLKRGGEEHKNAKWFKPYNQGFPLFKERDSTKNKYFSLQ